MVPRYVEHDGYVPVALAIRVTPTHWYRVEVLVGELSEQWRGVAAEIARSIRETEEPRGGAPAPE